MTKYHLDMPLYVTTFAFVFNKDRYNQMSAAQKKVIDDHCTTKSAITLASPWADFEHGGIAKLKAEGHEVYSISPDQLALWKKSAEPVVTAWAAEVKKAGGDPDTILKELKAELAKANAAY